VAQNIASNNIYYKYILLKVNKSAFPTPASTLTYICLSKKIFAASAQRNVSKRNPYVAILSHIQAKKLTYSAKKQAKQPAIQQGKIIPLQEKKAPSQKPKCLRFT
jgi:hypothetical protein